MSKRTTVTLSAADQDILKTLADPTTPEAATIRQLAQEFGIDMRDRSESALIRALMAAGAAVVSERTLERGYQELALLYPDVHDATETAERRRRYAHRVDANMDE
jgi:predicted DNA binding protein